MSIKNTSPYHKQLYQQILPVLEFFGVPIRASDFERNCLSCMLRLMETLHALHRDTQTQQVLYENLKRTFFNYYSENKGFLTRKDLQHLVCDLFSVLSNSDSSASALSVDDPLVTSFVENVALHDEKISFEKLNEHLDLAKVMSHVSSMDSLSSQESTSKKEQSNYVSFSSGNLKKMSADFKPILEFFEIKPSGNMMRDMILLIEAITEQNPEINEKEATNPLDKDLTRFEKQIIKRMNKFLFQYYDTDRDNKLNHEELKHLLRDMGNMLGDENMINISDEKVDSILQNMDIYHKGSVDFDEFEQFLTAH